ncbi:aminotransferase class I and II protein [Ceratobasidium sp. AG-Ba]|nr:aminotransferase class I and II protein [Ceratobasidium sp. AG-Ba]QRV99654.1 aminotransferase class I and II protein [Ceratobasidium sp. AG-Ba]
MAQPELSARAKAYVHVLKQPFDFAWTGELYNKARNPDGIIKLSTAENSLLTKELLEYFNSNFELTPSHLKYRWTLLNDYERSTKHALPDYFNAYFKPRTPITPEHCVHGDGLGSLLAQTVWALCQPGDGVLMATQLTDSYPRDIVYPAQAKVVPAYIPPSVNPLSKDTIPYLRKELENPENKIRAIIFCNPHNPLANAYPEEIIVEHARLAEEFNVHLISDEVYGLQVFSSRYVPNPTPFKSILSLSIPCNPARIHVLAGPTKDFGASGIKVGSLISQHNPDLLRLVERAVQALPMSSAADALFTKVLSDVQFRDWFLEENRKRLRQAFELAGDWCTFHNLSFVPASAGVFFVVDFAPLCARISSPSATTYDQTLAAFKAMQSSGVYIVPMTISEDSVVTRYRMTFTLPPETMRLALQRIERAFGLDHWEPGM